MLIKKKHILLLLYFLIFQISLNAPFALAQEEKCGTVPLQNLLLKNNAALETEYEFEQWINQQIQLRKKTAARQLKSIYTIPVVVHVVHNGESYGTGSNIPNEQIYSQINTLNEDFRRLNADRVNTPQAFQNVAADVEVEFVLAQRSPEGLATTGITRTQGTKSSYVFSDAGLLSEISYWPAEDYMNIWVAPLTGNLLGWGQFPLSNLPGLDNVNTNRRIDGIAIDFEYFGTGYNALAFSKGRTATHEAGHFLGLRHIWGDGGCGATDYVNDTPDASGFTSGCPNEKATCDSPDMFQNYMDYTNDVCMNLFTQGQKERMQIVMENSPRRRSLLDSKGGLPPEPLPLDAGIRPFIDPLIGSCIDDYQPSVTIINFGLNDILQMRVQLFINQVFEQELLVQQVISSMQSVQLNFNPLALSEALNNIEFRITSVNSRIDDNTTNDTLSLFVINPKPAISANEQVLDLKNWDVYNPDSGKTWVISNDGNSAGVDFYNYKAPNSLGQQDWLISPSFDVRDFNFPVLELEYAQAEGNNVDGLQIRGSVNCGESFSYPLFNRSGTQLATTFPQASAFSPNEENDWQKVEINLAPFTFFDSFILSIISTNGEGNSLFIRNLKVKERYPYALDAAVILPTTPPLIQCENSFNPQVRVENKGYENIQSLSLRVSANGDIITQSTVNTNISPGQSVLLNLAELTGTADEVTLLVEVTAVNGQVDENPSNNQQQLRLIRNIEETPAPFRLDFTAQDFGSWTFVTTPEQLPYQIINSDEEKRGVLRAETSKTELLQRYWLISPIFSLQGLKEALFTFKLAYRAPYLSNERVRILLSDNCGVTYDQVVWNYFLEDLTADFGNHNTDFNEETGFFNGFIDLRNELNKDNLRLAIEIISGGGNDVLIKDVALFDRLVIPMEVPINNTTFSVFPNPARTTINLVFDLETHEKTNIRIADSKGNIINRRVFENTLNQQLQFNVSDFATGMYFIIVQYDDRSEVRKIMVQR